MRAMPRGPSTEGTTENTLPASGHRPGSYTKLGVVAHQDDVETMLQHTLIQAHLRGLLTT
jgi:hypothetical protein